MIIHVLTCAKIKIQNICKKYENPPANNRVGSANFGPSPLSSRHGSQESLRHLNNMGSMSMLQTPTSSVCRDPVSAAQKKKGIKSSLGRFFSKKEKVCPSFECFNDSVISKTLLFGFAAKRCQGFDARRFCQHDVHEWIVDDERCRFEL